MVRRILAAFSCIFSLVYSAQAQNISSTDSSYTLFFIGDCGEPTIENDLIGDVLRREVTTAGAKATVIYLGDNIYPRGMPGQSEPGRQRAEKILKTQVDWMRGTLANGIVIPGNHDWQHWGKKGWQYDLNQQAWIDSLHDEHITYLPREACPGPVEVPLSDKALLVIIDTQWLLHEYEKPNEETGCEAESAAVLMTMLDDIYNRNKNKRIILAAHHPVISYGEHGGVFSLQDHLFPLVDVRPHLYIPMPVVGSLYPLYRSLVGHPQDIKHPLYHSYSTLMQKLLKKYPGSFYVAGHEHALQYILKDSVHYVVSGSGSKTTFVKKKKHAVYAKGVRGFVKLSLRTDGTASMEYWQVDNQHSQGEVVFKKEISAQQIELAKKTDSTVSKSDYNGKVVRIAASHQYQASKFHKKLLGANYRDAWEQPIEVPVFNIRQEQGGLKILQKGGGQQTLSLRLSNPEGKEFVLRSVEKFPENAVPEMFRKTFAQDLVQDQISASHPYAAVVIPKLADAAGIYHTNPKIVFIPDDPALGEYQKLFGNSLAVFEERPAGDWRESAFFGGSKNIINTSKVLEKLYKDHDNRVDEQFVLRSRLFDLWIGDWDRHDDQWRWATFKEGKKDELFRPIPRDRDQAFFVNQGIIPKIWSRRWGLSKFEGFDEAINWPSGLSYNARFFDRTFLTGLTEDEWISMAKDLQARLTDEVIENAIRTWPKEIFELNGEAVTRKLKARRATLVQNAISHYKFLARAVDVVGSDKDELFAIDRLPEGDVNVEMFKITKEGEKGKKLYARKFIHGETKEIRLYGLKGNDKFEVKGSSSKTILVRIIGGGDVDTVADNSHIVGLKRKTIYYDTKENTLVDNGEVSDHRSDDPEINQYDRKTFKYDRLAPLVFGNFNPDDGVFVGGGLLFQKEGFRKTPFAQRHIALASVAPRTQSFNFIYRGDFTDVLGRWGLEVNADLKSPNYVNNFFGMGNESVFNKNIDKDPAYSIDNPIDYYRFRFEELKSEVLLTRALGNWVKFKVGPAIQRIEVEEYKKKTRFINEYATTLPYNLFDEYNAYTGPAANLVFDKRDNAVLTTRGLVAKVEGRSMIGLNRNTKDFSSLETSMSFYQSFKVPARIVFALRVGAGHNWGNYAFYQAQVLSGRTELRGFRKTRFYGDSKFYTNLEMRMKLLSFRSYLFPASMGIVGFHDLGRVWYKDANGVDPSSATGTSHQWHRGWGGGIWFTPFNLTVLSIEAGHTKEGTLGYVRLGFLF